MSALTQDSPNASRQFVNTTMPFYSVDGIPYCTKIATIHQLLTAYTLLFDLSKRQFRSILKNTFLGNG